jgi:sulfatase modifying factor 1
MRATPRAACAVFFIGCGSPPETSDATVPVAAGDLASTQIIGRETLAADATDANDAADANRATPGAARARRDAGPPCPDDMVYADTTFCSEIERRCIDLEHERINHLDICHSFEHEQHCRGEERPIEFCIDRYEYPNRKGAHPTWMIDWYEAQATCESKGKRLCYSSEWTAACEGPDHTPFPYGYERDHRACNIDNFFIDPMRPGPKSQFYFYSKEEWIARRELSRLDQSVPSGSMERCRSGFDVYDMTGNFDEWVVSDEPPREKSKWAGLKGGAWGHVRSQCRPMTYSHEPEFRYYFVGFRCCRDVAGAPPWMPSPSAMPAPSVEAHDFAREPIVAIRPPGPSKTKFTWVPKRE